MVHECGLLRLGLSDRTQIRLQDLLLCISSQLLADRASGVGA